LVKHILLIIIVVGFTALALLYSFVVPLGEGPDEPGHASYVFFVARTLRLPDQRRNEVPGEGHQPPLAYALAAPLVAWLPIEQRQFDLPGNPRFTWSGGNELNAVAHGSREYWRWQGFVLAWHLARLVSVLLGAATVVFTYLTAKAFDCRLQIADCRLGAGQSTIYNLQSTIPLLAAALVAFNPQFVFASALITNDALLTALSAAMLWLVVRNAEPFDIQGRRRNGGATESANIRAWPRQYGHTVLIGLVLGLALITKQSALLLLPVAGLSVLTHSWRAGRAWRNDQKQGILSPYHPSTPRLPSPTRGRAGLITLSHIGLFVVVTLLICGWWYVRNRQLYGDLFGLAVFQRVFATGPFDARSPAAWWAGVAQLHASFWARFGWMNLPAPRWAIWLFGAIEAFALGGWLRRLIGSGKTIEDGGSKLEDGRSKIEDSANREIASYPPSSILHLRRLMDGHWALLALPLLAFAWVVSFASTAGLVAWQGRLLFPALPAIAIVLATGLAAWQNPEPRTENRRLLNRYWFLVLGSWFLVALWLPFGVIRPAYPFHTLPERAALERIGAPTYGRLGLVGDPGAELRGWLLAGELRPANSIDLRLIWHALGRQNRNWTVFVHLVDANEQIVAQDDDQPQTGAFPMKQWVAGDWVEDHHALALPAGVAPGSYTLRVGLFDPRTGRRVAVFDQQGKLVGDYVDLGQVRIE
jgi:Protein of unknown function (DUF2723)